MKFKGVEPIYHSIWTDCNRRRIYIGNILESQVQLQSQHIQESQSLSYEDAMFQLEPQTRELTNKEAVQILWHSFRFSQWHIWLQFNMLYEANQVFWNQQLLPEELQSAFKDVLKIWKKNTTTEEWEEPNWCPPHPKSNSITIEQSTDIALSVSNSHDKVSSDIIDQGIDTNVFIATLLKGNWSIRRTIKGWTKYTSTNQQLRYKWKVLEKIFERDFKYLLQTQDINWRLLQSFGYVWDETFPWRPNRDEKNDWTNNQKDRYFSYFIWYIIWTNRTGNEFFDKYFWELRTFFKTWFSWLPSDNELKQISKDENLVYWNSFRKTEWKYWRITKEDVLLLIAQYNSTHPDTQVKISELWLSDYPQVNIEKLKETLQKKDL